MRTYTTIILLMFVSVLALTSCSLTSNGYTNDSSRVIYQPPIKAGETGRIIRIPKSSGASVCGQVSPTYHWLYERTKILGGAVDPRIYEYPSDTEKTYFGYEPNIPSENNNVINTTQLLDGSWDGILSDAWGLGKLGAPSPGLRQYSLEEIQCWSSLGDQLAIATLAHFYLMLEADLLEGKVSKHDSALTNPRTAAEASLLRIELLRRAAARPDTPDVCDKLSPNCSQTLLRPFPLGLPSAHWSLLWAAKRKPELVEQKLIATSDYHLTQALLSGYGPAYDYKYNIQRSHVN